MPTRISIVPAIAVLAMLSGLDAHAQTNAEINASLQFDFSNPGARSLGLAGAFTAVADDATAAYTNPAGLMNLTRMEFSFEGRGWQYANEFLNRGNASGTPSGTGFDTVAGLQYGRTNDSAGGISFGSFVYPTARWAVAGYYHTRADFKDTYRSSGPFYGNGGPRLFPVGAALDMKITNFGGSAAFKINPKLSVGAGVSLVRYEGTSVMDRYQVGNFFESPNYAANNVLVNLKSTGDATDTAINAGFLLKATDRVSIGGVYRKGSSFDLAATAELGPGHPAFPLPVLSFPAEFHVPDVVGFGVAVRPIVPLTISVDWNFVRYSQLTDGFRDLLNRPQYQNDFIADDGNELRLGAQYVFSTLKYPIAVRGGTWYDPDHRVRYTGHASATDVDFIEKRSFEILFQPGSAVTHFTAGVGAAVGPHFQIDFGYDHSDLVKTTAVSVVARF